MPLSADREKTISCMRLLAWTGLKLFSSKQPISSSEEGVEMTNDSGEKSQRRLWEKQGDVLRRLREGRGLSEEQLANQILAHPESDDPKTVTKRSVTNYENGITAPQFRILYRLFSILQPNTKDLAEFFQLEYLLKSDYEGVSTVNSSIDISNLASYEGRSYVCYYWASDNNQLSTLSMLEPLRKSQFGCLTTTAEARKRGYQCMAFCQANSEFAIFVFEHCDNDSDYVCLFLPKKPAIKKGDYYKAGLGLSFHQSYGTRRNPSFQIMTLVEQEFLNAVGVQRFESELLDGGWLLLPCRNDGYRSYVEYEDMRSKSDDLYHRLKGMINEGQ